MHLPDIAEPTTLLTYTGDAKQLSRLFWRNLFFGPLTLGLYWLRGWVDTRNYVWQHIYVGSEPLGWVGSYADQRRANSPLGRLLVALAVAGFGMQVEGAVSIGSAVWTGSWLRHSLVVVVSIGSAVWTDSWLRHSLVVVVSLSTMPYLQSMSYSFQLAHSSWKGARFGHDGTAQQYARVWFWGVFINVITLNLAYGAFAVNTRAYLINNSRWGNIKAQYTGAAKEVHSMYILGALASVVTLGAYLPWHMARIRNYHANRTSLGSLRLRSTQEGSSLSNLWLGNFLICLFTLGLGYAAARSRSLRYQMAHLQLLGPAGSLTTTTHDGGGGGGGGGGADGLVDFVSMGGDRLFGA